MKKNIHKIHIWLSVPVGLIIFITCFSGAILVFETEITEMCNSERYYNKELKDNPLAIKELIETVNSRLPDSLQVSNIQIYADNSRNYRLGASGQPRTAIYVDPYTGEIKDIYQPGNDFFSTMRKLHRWLLDDFKRDGSLSAGKTIVGVTTIIFVFIIITGLISWLPKTIKSMKDRLRVRTKYGWKRFLHSLHIAGGIYSATVLLALALTGLTWSFSWYRTGFYKVFGAEIQQQLHNHNPRGGREQNNQGGRPGKESGAKDGNKRQKGTDFSKWQIVVDQLKSENPDFKTISVQEGKASLSRSSIIGNNRASDSYAFNPSTGEITETKLYKDQEKAGKIRGWIYSVHVGSWGGLVTKIITFFAALLGASLPLTGYYLWVKKHFRKRK